MNIRRSRGFIRITIINQSTIIITMKIPENIRIFDIFELFYAKEKILSKNFIKTLDLLFNLLYNLT